MLEGCKERWWEVDGAMLGRCCCNEKARQSDYLGYGGNLMRTN